MINIFYFLIPKRVSFYLIKHFLSCFSILTVGILSLIYLITFVELIRKIDTRETVDNLEMLYLTFAQIGPIIDQIIPFLILLATLWSTFSLLKTSEIIILKVSSFSLWRLSIIYCVVTIVIVSIYTLFLMPLFASMHQDYRVWESNRAQIYQNIHKKTILDNKNIAFIRIKKYDIFTHKAYGIFVSILDKSNLLKSVYYANEGQYDKRNKKIRFDMMQTLEANEKNISVSIQNSKFLVPIDLSHINRVSNNKKTMTHLYEYPVLINNQKKQNLSFKNLQTLFFSLLILPFTCSIYCFMAISTLPNLYRGLQSSKNILFALLAGLVFYILDNWIVLIAITNNLPTVMAIFVVKIAVTLLCIVTIFNKEYGFNKIKVTNLIKESF